MINRKIHQVDMRSSFPLASLFKDIPVANIADEMSRMSCLDSEIRPYNDRPLLGVAITVKACANDNLAFHKAIQMSEPGTVIVVDNEGSLSHSLCGEMMYSMARGRGAEGFVIDGAIRDVASLRSMDFSVYARGVQPRGPFKNGPGEVNVPVSVGGIVIHPGDIICGDSDGVVVIRPEDAIETAKAARERFEKEKTALARINGGDTSCRWLEQKLQDNGFEIVY